MFIKSKWEANDITLLENYLESIKNEEKIEWTRNIINTKMPVLAIKLEKLREIVKEMKKGEFYSFLDNMPTSSFEILTISGYLISEIKDFKIQKNYIKKYALKCDNWSNCDTLSFKIKNNEGNYISLSKELVKSKKTFVRRVGVDILFSLVKKDNYSDEIFNILDSLSNEEEYYVNMAIAWLLCEMFIKQRKKTIEYLNHNNLNKFAINKAISKCRDSFRVSKTDKEMLLKYKK